VDTLSSAAELQKTIVSSNRLSASANSLEKDKELFSEIKTSLGMAYLSVGNKNLAQDSFNEALQSNQSNTKAMLGLAKLYKLKGEIEQCQAQCNKIVLINPADEEGAVLLADVTFSTADSEQAIKPLQDLLRSKPNNYFALEKMIILLRRAGRLQVIIYHYYITPTLMLSNLITFHLIIICIF
jgi:tetratricopeptide repeat protein 21B